MLLTDLRTIHERDPAAQNWLEVLFCYPGFHALLFHRVAHWFYSLGIPFVPRLISHISRWLTGIEIHPGAKIGNRVFIDHGIGVVIGETAVIGDDVAIYQQVTLGGTGKQTGKRHPTLGNNVIVEPGAKVLGNIQIGNHVRIGAGSVVLRDVPDHHTVFGVPGHITYQKLDAGNSLHPGILPDLEAQVIRALFERIQNLEQELEYLEKQFGVQNIQPQELQISASSKASNLLIEEFLDGAGI